MLELGLGTRLCLYMRQHDVAHIYIMYQTCLHDYNRKFACIVNKAKWLPSHNMSKSCSND